MWSLRMRASLLEKNREIHISGAEGIYKFEELERVLKKISQKSFRTSKWYSR